MTKQLLWLVAMLFTNSGFAARCPGTSADSISPDYDRASDLCLFHQFADAELLLNQIVRRSDHPNRDYAQLLLTEEVYLYRGLYGKYVHFADSTGHSLLHYAFAKKMLTQPTTQIGLSVDSMMVGFKLKKKGLIIVEVLVNGKPRNFMVDTGCQRTIISDKLANELQLTRLLNDAEITNSLGQAVPSSISILDSLQLGGLRVANLPVYIESLWGFGVDGALGWDILRHLCFTIDYANQKLVLRRPVSQTVAIKNLLGGSRPLVTFRSETGNQLNLFFDSGSNERVSFSPNGLTKIGPYESGRKLGFELGFGGRMQVRREKTVKCTNIRISEHLYHERKTHVKRLDDTICGVIIDGTVGSGQFRKGHLTVDFANNRFVYTE